MPVCRGRELWAAGLKQASAQDTQWAVKQAGPTPGPPTDLPGRWGVQDCRGLVSLIAVTTITVGESTSVLGQV